MNNNKFYIIIISTLLIINLLLVIFNFLPQRKMGPPAPKEIIIGRLQFDENQIKEYEALIKIHRNIIKEKDQQIRELKNKLYKTLKGERNIQIEDATMLEINKIQNEIEHIHYNHFSDIKSICNKDQMQNFDELIGELDRIFAPMPPRRK